MAANDWTQILIAPAALSVLAGTGWVVRRTFARQDANTARTIARQDAEADARSASRAEQAAFDRSLFTDEFARLRAELQAVTPQLASLRKEYSDSVAREVALMEQYRRLQYEATEERGKLRAAIRVLHAEVRRLRRALEDNGIRVPVEPLRAYEIDPVLDYETEDDKRDR